MFLNDHLTSVCGWQPRYGIAIDRCIASRSSQWRPFLALRSPLHPGDASLASYPLIPRNSRRTRSAVVREQTGYRATAYPWVPRAPNNCKNTRTRDLHNILVNIKDVSSLPFHRVTALDDCRGWRARRTEIEGVDESAGTTSFTNWKKRAMCTRTRDSNITRRNWI